MSESKDIIALIDQRIRASRLMTRSLGTLQSRDSIGPGAFALFDGSTQGVPVKVPGSVFAQPGDRVMLDLYGVEWVVTAAFNEFGLGTASKQQFASSSGPLTSSTYTDLTDITPMLFTKVFDASRVRMSIACGGFTDTATNTALRFGLLMTPLDPDSTYTPITYELGWIFFSQTGMHMSGTAGMQSVSGIPSGTYSCQVRWKRSQGTGRGNANTGDLFVIDMDELVTGYVPPA